MLIEIVNFWRNKKSAALYSLFIANIFNLCVRSRPMHARSSTSLSFVVLTSFYNEMQYYTHFTLLTGSLPVEQWSKNTKPANIMAGSISFHYMDSFFSRRKKRIPRTCRCGNDVFFTKFVESSYKPSAYEVCICTKYVRMFKIYKANFLYPEERMYVCKL